MGRKVSDGKSFDLTVPGGHATADMELYRIAGKNGICIGVVAVADVERTKSFEADPPAIYSVHCPSGVNPNPGDFLYWATNDGTTFQDCHTNLAATPNGLGEPPCFWVTAARSSDGAGGYVVRGRVLNGVTGVGSLS